MKKMLVLFLLLAGFTAYAQGDLTRKGVTHTIADAYLSAADSSHDFGLISMMDDDGAVVDSIQIEITSEDSLHARVLLAPDNKLDRATIADTVGVLCIAGDATGGPQFLTSAQRFYWSWLNITTALKPAHNATQFHLWVKVYAVGSEVASSGKKFMVRVKKFYHESAG